MSNTKQGLHKVVFIKNEILLINYEPGMSINIAVWRFNPTNLIQLWNSRVATKPLRGHLLGPLVVQYLVRVMSRIHEDSYKIIFYDEDWGLLSGCKWVFCLPSAPVTHRMYGTRVILEMKKPTKYNIIIVFYIVPYSNWIALRRFTLKTCLKFIELTLLEI